MDLFLLNPQSEEPSLQDMIDTDLKYEFGMSRYDDFSADFSLTSFENDLCMKTLEPLFDVLPGMDMDSPSAATPAPSTYSSCSSSSSSLEDDQSRLALEQGINEIAWLGASASHKDMTFDENTAIMVNPSSVLPSILPSRSLFSSAATSPLLSTHSPLLSSSPVLLASVASSSTVASQASITTSCSVSNYISTSSNASQTVYIKTESLHNSVTSSSAVQMSEGSSSTTHVTVLRPTASSNLLANSSSSIASSPTIITPRQLSQHVNISAQRLQLANSVSNTTNGRPQTIVAHSGARLSQQTVTSAPITTVHTTSNNAHMFRGKPSTVRTAVARRPEERVLPKPAYSYSCLIALALKNSTMGSLPVSEIYSFMCEYFPYFRTAPNGWKNSVRHNLSLNKCFEKIEKPAVTGNNQRKGCLWALNPNKVHKMDEEIQKWSKKDLQGIRDAMNNPDVLGALERGEMKFEAASNTSSCSEDEDEDDEVDALTLTEPPTTLATLKFVNGTSSHGGHLLSTGLPSRTVVPRTTLQTPQRTTLQIHTNKQQPTILRQANTGQLQHKIRANAVFSTASSNSPPQEPEFILPDSTMTEISFQANGALVDDLGNEISIEEEVVSSSNNVASNVSVVSTPRSVVLRKVTGVTPVVRSPGLRTNYVYSPTVTSPHQHGLNRLVLTNAKMV